MHCQICGEKFKVDEFGEIVDEIGEFVQPDGTHVIGHVQCGITYDLRLA